MSVQSYMLFHTANFQPMTNLQSRDFNCRTLMLQLTCRQTMLKNINWAQVCHYKLGLFATWGSENWDISSLSWREYNSMVWAHDESQDSFGKFPKIGTWKVLTEQCVKKWFLANGRTSKTMQMDSSWLGNWHTGRLPWGQYDSTVSTHDESRGTNDGGTK